MIGQGIDADRYRLAGAQARKLGLLEIGVDIDVVERHQAGDALPGLHVVAGLHRAIGEHAVDRRADHGEGEIALGLGQRRLEFVERARGLLLLRLEHVEIGRGGIDPGLRIVDRG